MKLKLIKKEKDYSMILESKILYHEIIRDNKNYLNNLLKRYEYLIEKEKLYTQKEIIDQKLYELENIYLLHINNK